MKFLQALYRGGMLAGHRTSIVAGAGIISAAASYLVGDTNILEAANSAFPLAAIYFLRKGLKDGK
jgi:hypothetical protein